MREFKNKIEDVYLQEEYYIKEEEFLYNDDIDENNYIDFDKVKFYEPQSIKRNTIIEYDYNIEKYKEEFIDTFLKIFPNIYSKKQLKLILDENVKSLQFVENLGEGVAGNYSFQSRNIDILYHTNTFERTKFHEFVHAVRGNEEIEKFNQNVGIIESFTAYIERIFIQYSKNKEEYLYKKKQYLYFKDLSMKIKNIRTYSTLTAFAQQLELLNSLTGDEESIVETFLKRENIYIKIKNIYMKYYELTGKTTDYEKNAEISTIQLINKIYTVYNDILCPGIDKNNIVYLINNVENETMELFNILNTKDLQNKDYLKNINIYNGLAITVHINTPEEILLANVFGYEIMETNLVNKIIEAMNNDTKKG